MSAIFLGLNVLMSNLDSENSNTGKVSSLYQKWLPAGHFIQYKQVILMVWDSLW